MNAQSGSLGGKPIGPRTPEARAALWKRLAQMAGGIGDAETRQQYLATWRARYDAAFPPPPPGLSEDAMLPDGSATRLSDQPEREQAVLRRVSASWLDRQTDTFRPTTPDALNRFAWWLGRRVSACLIEREAADAAVAELIDAIPGAMPDDATASFAAGERKGYDLDAELLSLRCAGHQRTEMGNAERFRDRFGRSFLYTTEKGWLGYDEPHGRYRVLVQEKDVTPAEVLGAIYDTVRAIQDEAALIASSGIGATSTPPTDGDIARWGLPENDPAALDRIVEVGSRKALLSESISKWGRASETRAKCQSIANMAQRWLTVQITDFDTDPMLFNCRNGTLRFVRPDDDGPARVELLPHSRDHMLTKVAACDYDADAEAPEFQKFMRWAQPGNGRRRYLRQYMGYCLTGDMGEQIFQIWWGPTAANGKSTFGNACRESAGDYGDITNVETFLDEGMKKRGDQATPDIVRLPGVRMLTSGEPGPGSKFNEPLINSVTGGDPMLARDNFRSFFRFSPAFKWIVWCNKKPEIVQGTEGIWRRAKVVLWESHLEDHQRDRTLPDRLKREYAGILAWMVRGTIDWMANGFVEPEDVTAASMAYRDDSDPLASFLRMCTVEEDGARVQSSHLYKVFCAWAKAAGESEWKQKGFSRALKDRGYDSKASNGMQWLGLRLVRDEADFLDEKGEVRTLDGDIASGVPAAHPPPASSTPPHASPRPPPDEAWVPPDDEDMTPFA